MTQKDSVPPSVYDDHFYHLLAGTASTRLLESIVDLRLPALLAEHGPRTAAEIAADLSLHPERTAKWLLLLQRIGLVDTENGKYKNSTTSTALVFDRAGAENFFVRDMIEYCRRVNALDFTAVLRGMPLPEAVRWPPRTHAAAEHLEKWMAITAADALRAIQATVDLRGALALLDVGGGDGTMACALARAHPELRVTIFNLPASAQLAYARVDAADLSHRIEIVEGDFLRDELPGGFDRIQFSRVLADWSPDTCQMLLHKARRALTPGGSVHLCEPFIDKNPDLALSWQFRYIFYDDFAVETYKFIGQYMDMLAAAGFSDRRVVDRVEDTLYGVIIAR